MLPPVQSDDDKITITEDDLKQVELNPGLPNSMSMKSMPSPERSLVTAQCVTTGYVYYVRFEMSSTGAWSLKDTISYGQDKASKVATPPRTEAMNRMRWDTGSLNCPHCKNSSIVKCGACDQLSCYNSSGTFKCPWCGVSGTVSGEINRLQGSTGKK